ncbi:hypothetical protein EDB89DRAFT_1546568 [Lactarius sanguifluus]|nr:hypothetical protein EDB89DRAFT_1546568 [Lactarius sanguifluus]
MTGHAVIDIRNTYGCSFIGLIISVMLFGITTLQTWIYYWQYGSRDQKALKLFIAVIFLLDALHTTLCIYSGILIQVLINTLIDYMVQLFYARRVYIVGGSIVIPIIIVIFGTACVALALVVHRRSVCVVYTLIIQIFETCRQDSDYRRARVPLCVPNCKLGPTPLSTSAYSLTAWQLVTCIGLGSAVVADILIAVSMCWFLYHKRTGFARTDSVIMTLMAYSVNSGLLTSVLTCAALISFSISPFTMYSLVFYWPMSKFYANSLLAMLNSRDYVRERSSTDNKPENAFNLSSIRIEQRSEGDKSRRPTVSVTVHRSATTDFPQGKRDHDVESRTIENSKLEASIPSEIHHGDRMSDWST